MSDISARLDQLTEMVNTNHRAIFGSPDNIKEAPGLIAEQMKMALQQERTNEILTELVDSVKWINRLIMGAIVTGLLAGLGALIWKGLMGH